MIAFVPSARPAGRSLAVSLLLASLAPGAGCSALSSGRAAPPLDAPASDTRAIVDDFPRSRRVAIDFVDAMTALPTLVPAVTTLYTIRPPSRFGEILVAALQSAGYDLRLGVGDAPVTLHYDVRAASDDSGGGDPRFVFVVVADGVRLERSYIADVGGIRADSPMRVGGRDATTRSRPVPSRPVRNRSVRSRPDSAPPPLDPSDTVAAPPLPIRRNLHDTGRSNYADLVQDYDTLRRDVMVFPNDSLHMGPDNKRLARRIARAFDPERDVISLIGCSHGPTALANGNETLANGRAYRVKEAFVRAGIEAGRVLEEGCWAGAHYAPMPARGVVVMHRRRTAG